MELRPDLWHCADCGTAYAVGLTCCPQCGSIRRLDAPSLAAALAPLMPETPPAEPEEM